MTAFILQVLAGSGVLALWWYLYTEETRVSAIAQRQRQMFDWLVKEMADDNSINRNLLKLEREARVGGFRQAWAAIDELQDDSTAFKHWMAATPPPVLAPNADPYEVFYPFILESHDSRIH